MSENYRSAAGKGGGDEGRQFELGRVVSVLAALVGLILAYLAPNTGVFHFTLAFVVLPLGCIWYGREIGSFSTSEEDGTYNPVGALITYTGWTVLVVMDGILVWLLVRS